MGEAQLGDMLARLFHHLGLYLVEEAVKQGLGHGVGGALAGKTRPLLVEVLGIGKVGEPGRLLWRDELLEIPGPALCLRLPDHPRADDEEVVEHEGGVHLVAHMGLAAVFRIHRHVIHPGGQLVDEGLAVETLEHLAGHHPGPGQGLERIEGLGQLGSGSHPVIFVPDKGLIGLEGGQIPGVLPLRLGLVEVELELVAQPLVDLGRVLLADVTVGAVCHQRDPFGQALHEEVGAFVGAILARCLDLEAEGSRFSGQQGGQPFGEPGRQVGVLLLTERTQQAIAEGLVGGRDGVHLGAEPLAQLGQGPLPRGILPHQLGQHIVFGAGQRAGAMACHQFGEDGTKAFRGNLIAVHCLTGGIDRLGAVLIVADGRRGGVVARIAAAQQGGRHAGGKGRDAKHSHP